jgi:hypothetical protein
MTSASMSLAMSAKMAGIDSAQVVR